MRASLHVVSIGFLWFASACSSDDARREQFVDWEELCSGEPAEPTLALIPGSGASIFRHATASCDSLAPFMVVKNASPSSVEVKALKAGPSAFEAVAGGLPRVLAPGESMTVQLAYDGDNEELEGALTIATDRGCEEFPVTGRNVTDENLIAMSHYAVHFADVRAGDRTEATRIVVRPQLVAGKVPPALSGFGAGPKGLFELTAAPEGEVVAESCEDVVVDVVFNAPSAAGAYEGMVSFETVSTTDDDQFFGLIGIPLSATVIER
jgi:hypothetical protein